MGYQTIGVEGNLTSWAGTFYSNLVSKIRSQRVNVTIGNQTIDVTGLGSYGATFIPGLSDWSATIDAFTLTQSTNTAPNTGENANVTFTNSTNVYIDSYTLNIESVPVEITNFSASPPVLWRSFRPDMIRWSGTMNARIDSANDILLPFLSNASPVSATFTYDTNATLAGSILITRTDPAIQVGGAAVLPISFVGTGTLTPAGTASVIGTTAFGGTSDTGIPEWNSSGSSAKAFVVALNSGNTLTGVDSFWQSLSLSVGVGQATKLAIGVRGSGGLSIT